MDVRRTKTKVRQSSLRACQGGCGTVNVSSDGDPPPEDPGGNSQMLFVGLAVITALIIAYSTLA